MALPVRNDLPSRTFPWVTLSLLAINIFVFLFVQPSGFQGSGIDERRFNRIAAEQEEFAYRWGSVACEITTGETVVNDPDGCEGDRGQFLPGNKSILLALLTSLFLHGNIAHLAGNMLFLWVFGHNVEDRLGRWNFLALYIVGGIAATMGFVAVNTSSAVPLIGASGAIAVAMGAFLVLFPRARILTIVATAAFQIVYVPAAVVLALFFVTQFFTAEENVAWEAHAAGMVAGVLGALALSQIPAVKRRREADAGDEGLRVGVDF